MFAAVFANSRIRLSRNGRVLLPAGFAALLLHLVENMVYCICNLILAIWHISCYTLCVEEEPFPARRPLAVHPCTAYFFCKNSGKASGSARPPVAAKKSDKNLRPPKNLVYYIQELRKRNLLRYIRRIRRRVRSFLCFRPPLSLPAAGVLCFAAGEIRHTIHINIKKRKEKKL